MNNLNLLTIEAFQARTEFLLDLYKKQAEGYLSLRLKTRYFKGEFFNRNLQCSVKLKNDYNLLDDYADFSLVILEYKSSPSYRPRNYDVYLQISVKEKENGRLKIFKSSDYDPEMGNSCYINAGIILLDEYTLTRYPDLADKGFVQVLVGVEFTFDPVYPNQKNFREVKARFFWEKGTERIFENHPAFSDPDVYLFSRKRVVEGIDLPIHAENAYCEDLYYSPKGRCIHGTPQIPFW